MPSGPEVRPHQCRAEQNNHLPRLASAAAPDAPQCLLTSRLATRTKGRISVEGWFTWGIITGTTTWEEPLSTEQVEGWVGEQGSCTIAFLWVNTPIARVSWDNQVPEAMEFSQKGNMTFAPSHGCFRTEVVSNILWAEWDSRAFQLKLASLGSSAVCVQHPQAKVRKDCHLKWCAETPMQLKNVHKGEKLQITRDQEGW